MKTNYRSDLAIHPGEFLEEILNDIGMSEDVLSKRMGRPVQVINEIIEDEKGITSTIASKLEDALKVPSRIWIGLEEEYQTTKVKHGVDLE